MPMTGYLLLCGELLKNQPFASHCADSTTARLISDAAGKVIAPCPWLTTNVQGVTLAAKIDSTGMAEFRCADLIVRRRL